MDITLPPPLPPRPSLSPSHPSSSSLPHYYDTLVDNTLSLPSKTALVELLSTTPKATANLITDLKPVFALWDGLDYSLSWKSPEITLLFWLFLLALCRWISVWSVVVPTPFFLFIGGLLGGFIADANGEKARRNSGLVPNPPSAKATIRMFYTTKLFRTFCAYLSLVRLLFLWRHPPSSRFALRTALALYPFWAFGWNVFFCFPRTTAGILCSAIVFWRAPMIVRLRDTIANLPETRRATKILKSAWAWWCQDFFGGNDPQDASRGLSPQNHKLKTVQSGSWILVSAMYRGIREVASKGKVALRKRYFARHQLHQNEANTTQIDHEGWLEGFPERKDDEASSISSGYEISDRGSETASIGRLNSSTGDLKLSGNPDSIGIFMTKEFSVFENQRWWVGLDWVPLMLPHDPPPWSDVNDLPSVPPQEFRFPPIPPELGSANRQATKAQYEWRWLEPKWREQKSVNADDGWEYRNHFWQNKLAKYRSADFRISLQTSLNASSSSLSSTSTAYTDTSSLSIPSYTTSYERGTISSKIVDPLMKIKKTTRTRTWVRRGGVVALEE